MMLYSCTHMATVGVVKGLTNLEISCLWHEPAVDELLRVFGKSEEEVSVRLELVNRFDGLMNLRQQNQILTTTTRHWSVQSAVLYVW